MAEKRKIKVPTGAVLSKYLRCLAVEVETMDNDGDPVTKAEALAKLVWQYALGFRTQDVKTDKETYTPPAVWAIELLYNRIEGRIPVAAPEESGKSLTDKVGDLAKAKINAAAKAAAGTEDEKEADEPGDDQA
jgi:hypothetical protein